MIGKRKRGGSKATESFRRVKPVEEVNFDFSKREEYLTGFHKRKLQRAKHAQEEAAKKERQEKIRERKELRESRQKELEEHIQAVNHAVRRAEGIDTASEEEDEESDDEWQGIDEPAPTVIHHEDQYSDSDEDQEATVTVEAVDVDRDGMHAIVSDVESDSDEQTGPDLKGEKPAQSKTSNASSTIYKRVWTKEKPKVPKKKRQKFRYESKGERKLNRAKIKAKKDKYRRARDE